MVRSICALRQTGTVRGKQTSQERRSSAWSCLMSFRWEVNHNREQRTPERAVLRKCCAAQQPPQGKQTAKSAVQSICAADHSGLDSTGFSKLEQLGNIDRACARPLFCEQILLPRSVRHHPVPHGQDWCQYLPQQVSCLNSTAAFSIPIFGALIPFWKFRDWREV